MMNTKFLCCQCSDRGPIKVPHKDMEVLALHFMTVCSCFMCKCMAVLCENVWFFPQALDTIASSVIVKITSLIFWDVVGRGCSKIVAMETVAIKLPFCHLTPDRRKAVMNNYAPSPLTDSHIYMGFKMVRICGRINAWLEKRLSHIKKHIYCLLLLFMNLFQLMITYICKAYTFIITTLTRLPEMLFL